MGTLREWLPQEFFIEHRTPAVMRLLDVDVTEKVDGTVSGQGWPGPHRWVMSWVKLANGKAVGWNENPGRGWSFPVTTLNK
jgi:hypothetical protein